jgi:subtilase family serine protease
MRVAPRNQVRTLAAAFSAGVLAVIGLAAAGPASARPTLARAQLAGTHPAWAVRGHLLAAPDASSAVTARVYLAGRDPAGLASYAAAVSDPSSAAYRKFLTASQEKSRYGPTAEQVAAVRSWLTSAGLRVTAVTQHYVAVTGAVSAADSAFAVTLASFRGAGGADTMAPEQDASVPASVRAAVLTVTGLDTAVVLMKPALPGPPPAFYVARPCSAYYGQKRAAREPAAFGQHVPWALCGYTPRQLRGAYGLSGGTSTGRGVTVAIVDAYASPTMPADASTYADALGESALGPNQYHQLLPASFDDASECGASGWYAEQTLDIEAVHAMAPAADIEYVAASDCTFQPLLDAITSIVDNHLADVVSNSWAGTEQGLTAVDTAPFDQVFEEGATEGIGFDFASGDCGYNDPGTQCGNADGSDELRADFPTSSPWVTGVGGTSLAIGKHDNYEWETGWGDMVVPLRRGRWKPAPPGRYPADYAYGGGGGTSTLYRQPSYQAGVVPPALAARLPGGKIAPAPMREVPDVAMDADPATGFLYGQTVRLRGGKDGFQLSRIGGTSLSSPLFAGLEADAAQDNGRHELGLVNPTLYAMAGTAAYHDVTGSPLGRGVRIALARNEWANSATGTGKINTELYTLGIDGTGKAALVAARGFDDVTGLGSPAGSFVTDLDGY